MAVKRLKVAVVGAGFAHSPDGRENFAIRAHLPALLALPEKFEVVAVCTRRMESATESARHFGVPHAYDDLGRMLEERLEIDVVCVAVRPSYHHSVVIPALRAGKHVYCEHPMGNSVKQARDMYLLAREMGVKTALGHQGHYHPAALEMSQRVHDGFIGRPLTFNHSFIVSNYIVPRPSHRQWLFQVGVSGHPAYRTGRALERIMAILGRDVTSVAADMAIKVPERIDIDTGGTIHSDQVDTTAYLLRMADGVSGTAHTSYAGWFGTGERFELYGTEGMLMLQSVAPEEGWHKETGAGDPNRGGVKLYGARVDMEKFLADPLPPERLERRFEEIPIRAQGVTDIPDGRSSYFVAQAWNAFHDSIVNDAPYVPSFTEGLKIHNILDAAERSVADKKWATVAHDTL